MGHKMPRIAIHWPRYHSYHDTLDTTPLVSQNMGHDTTPIAMGHNTAHITIHGIRYNL